MGSPSGSASSAATSPSTGPSGGGSGGGGDAAAEFEATVAAERETPRSSGGRSFDDPPPAGGGGGGSWGGDDMPEPQQAGAVAVALPAAGAAALADGPLPFGDAVAVGILAGAGLYAGYQYLTRPDDASGASISQSQASSPGFTGEPGSTETVYNPDGTPRQTRTYGEDGYPAKDIDYNHDHGQGQPHVHDWGRPEDGGPPTHEDRQPGRPPREGEVE